MDIEKRGATLVVATLAFIGVGVNCSGGQESSQPGSAQPPADDGGAGGISAKSAGGSGGANNGGAVNAGGAGGEIGGGASLGVCEQGCDKFNNECGFGIPCADFYGGALDCSAAHGDCVGQCILGADCTAIASLQGDSPDPTLKSCADTCMGGSGGSGAGGSTYPDCQTCVQSECSDEIQGCLLAPQCSKAGQCIYSNCAGLTDYVCLIDCLNQHPSTTGDEVINCLCGPCGTPCEPACAQLP